MEKRTDAWVCEDCYFAHHHGVTEHDGEWFAGESDTPSDRKPLTLLDGYELGDGTGENGEGSDTFSWRSCDGCGSTLGGSRFRLAVFSRCIVTPALRAEAEAYYHVTRDEHGNPSVTPSR